QLRITDRDGHRLTAFVTNTRGGQLADLELRHRQRARCEDRIRAGKQTGLAGFPFKSFAQNQIWLAIVSLAAALAAWTQLVALTGHPARKWEPKRLRLRLFSVAARITRHARKTRLRLSATAPWSALIVAAIDRLTALPAPTRPARNRPPDLKPSPLRRQRNPHPDLGQRTPSPRLPTGAGQKTSFRPRSSQDRCLMKFRG